MQKTSFALVLLVLIVQIGCSTRPISVYPVNKKTIKTITGILEEKEAGGFFFSLPQTVINVDTNIEVKSQTAGKYYKAFALHDAYQVFEKSAGNIDVTKFQNCEWLDPDSITKMGNVLQAVSKIVASKDFMTFETDSNYRKYFKKTFDAFIEQIHEDYVKENKTQYTLKSGSVTISSEPDPQKLFFATVPKDKLESKGVKLTLTEQGTPSSASAASTNNTLDYTFAAVKSVAAVIGVASAVPSIPKSTPSDFKALYCEQLKKDYLAIMRSGLPILAYAKDMETDIDAMKRDITTYRYLDTQLKTLLKSRNTLTSEAYAQMIKPILDRMTQIRQRFTGSKTSETKTAKARIVPDSPADLGGQGREKYLLFSYNEDGLFYPTDKDFMTAKIGESPIQDTGDSKKYKIILSTDTKPFNTSTAASMKTIQSLYATSSGNYPHGMPFNVPGLVKIEALVAEGDNEQVKTVLKTEVCRLSQFGTMGHMPHKIDGKSCQYSLTYFEDTGAIKVMDVNSTSFDASAVNAVSEGLAAILSIETVRLQNEAAKATAKKTIEDAE